MLNDTLALIVLAAGKGTRMLSDRPKVLHEVFFAPMVFHVLRSLRCAFADLRPIVVVGHGGDVVAEAVSSAFDVAIVVQPEQLGTGHAVSCCKEQLADYQGQVLILCGDAPLIGPETLRSFVAAHLSSKAPLSVMTTGLARPTGYGRVVLDEHGSFLRIVEEKDASDAERAISEVNAGIYCADWSFLRDALELIGCENCQGEMYLTDVVGIAVRSSRTVNRFFHPDSEELLGVNSRSELAAAHAIMQERFLKTLMASGVSIVQPALTTVAGTVTIGADSIVFPYTSITGETTIGAQVFIDSFVKIVDCSIADGAKIGPYCHLQGRTIRAGAIIPANTRDSAGQ